MWSLRCLCHAACYRWNISVGSFQYYWAIMGSDRICKVSGYLKYSSWSGQSRQSLCHICSHLHWQYSVSSIYLSLEIYVIEHYTMTPDTDMKMDSMQTQCMIPSSSIWKCSFFTAMYHFKASGATVQVEIAWHLMYMTYKYCIGSLLPSVPRLHSIVLHYNLQVYDGDLHDWSSLTIWWYQDTGFWWAILLYVLSMSEPCSKCFLSFVQAILIWL